MKSNQQRNPDRRDHAILTRTSLSVGQRKTPNIIPSGYADDSDPNEAPSGRPKCLPSDGCMGEVMVNPRRFRNEAKRTAGTERSLDSARVNADAGALEGGLLPPPPSKPSSSPGFEE